MLRYIAMRFVGLAGVLIILSVITFGLMHGVPGGPWKVGQRPFSDEQIKALEARYGLDKPIHEQYFIWLKGVVRLDFGKSFQHPDETVLQLIGRTWPVTMHLGLMSLSLAFLVGLPLGIIAALKQNSWIDYITTLVSIFGVVTPHFVWAIFFILLFSLKLKLFPTGGWETPQQWIMPVVVYALGPMAIIARYTRTSVIEVIRSDYVRTARSKGMREYDVIMKHVMKNAMLPMVTVLGPLIPDMITGSIFVESIFRVPGLGKFWVSSTLNRDYPMIIGLTLLWAVLIAITYLITDLVYIKLDPRVRLK